MKSRAYRAVDVNRIDLAKCLQGREAKTVVHAGLDIGKETILTTLRWSADLFDRPWRASNPFEVNRLTELLSEVGRGRTLIVALEPTGTYGDALRQALERAGLVVHRVSPKNASDYAEVFDGVPSQHDGKDSAVVADLAAQGEELALADESADRGGAGAGLSSGLDGRSAPADDAVVRPGGSAFEPALAGSDADTQVGFGDATALPGEVWRPPRSGGGGCPRRSSTLGRALSVGGKSASARGQCAADGGRDDGPLGRRTPAAIRVADTGMQERNTSGGSAYG
jgi:hypothetical protein